MWQRSIFKALIATCAVVLAIAARASAASFSVDPISVTLPKGDSSASVAVTNQSGQKLRLQVTGFAWQQKPSGEMALSPTDNLVFFPQLLTLAPGETRRIRIGVTTSQGAMEKSYRVFMEELPSLESVVKPKTAGVVIRMKVGIPVFVSPNAQASRSGEVRNVTMHDGTLSFDVANTGNTHFSIQTVRISGVAASGVPVFTQDISGWYVLPGGIRHYSVQLPKGKCALARELKIAVRADGFDFNASAGDLTRECSSSGS